MIGPGTGVRVYLACGVTDMRKGIAGLAALAQDVPRQKPMGGAVFAVAEGDDVPIDEGQDEGRGTLCACPAPTSARLGCHPARAPRA